MIPQVPIVILRFFILLSSPTMLILNQVKHKFSNRFIRNVGWLGIAEILNRIFGLGTTVLLSRALSFEDYGLLAIVLTVQEFGTIFTAKAGLGAKLVQASEEDVDTLCETVYWMSCATSVAMFILQCLIAFPIAWFYHSSRVIAPLCLLAITYLGISFMAVPSALLERAGRLNVFAICQVGRSFLANALTVLFIFLGWGLWAVILATALSILPWVIIPGMFKPWKPKTFLQFDRWRETATYAGNIIGVELLAKLRDNLDYLLVGRFLGIEALGVYYFAFNAGLGISLSVMNTLITSLWSHLCEARSNLTMLKKHYRTGLKTIASTLIPVVILQVCLAPWYVPIIFGEHRRVAIPVLMLICLSAIPRPFFLAASQLLNALDKTKVNLFWSILFTTVYGIALFIGVQFGVLPVALAVLISQVLITPLFVFWVRQQVFKPATIPD
ncbi:MAG: lipopolysaccharide biosynthesis protein [Synechococcales bacterium]|nr:lipopolysaccharide biosynthesis protein [Synechococcales bacterium]